MVFGFKELTKNVSVPTPGLVTLPKAPAWAAPVPAFKSAAEGAVALVLTYQYSVPVAVSVVHPTVAKV